MQNLSSRNKVYMLNFRAINLPSKSPLKPTVGERPLPDAVSRQKCQMEQGQASARQLVSVLLTDKQSRRKPKCERNLRQEITEGEGASQKPKKKKKKKRKPHSSPSMPRRQQADREKKLVHSIEYSPRKATGSSTPESNTDGAGDSEYRPSTTDMADSILSSISNTPSRRSPREHSARYPNAASSVASGSTPGSSPSQASSQDDGTLAIIKRECSPIPRPTSPSTLWNSETRRQRYKEFRFVELPKEVFDYEQSKKKMAIKKEVMVAGKRKKKGKSLERNPIEESTQKTDKRKAEDQVEQNEPRKRSKSQKSQKPDLEDHSLTYDAKNSSESPQTSNRMTARRSPKGKAVMAKAENPADITDVRSHAGKSHSPESPQNEKVQRFLGAGAEARDLQRREEKSGPSGNQSSRVSGQQKRSFNKSSRTPHRRRDVNRWDNDPLRVVSQYAHGGSSTDGQKDSDMRRAQSSISPPDFYGNEGWSRPSANAGMSSRSVPGVERSPPTSRNSHSTSKPFQPPKNAISGCSPYNSRPVRDRSRTSKTHAGSPVGQPPNPAVVNSSSSHLTPPNSSPLGQRRKAGAHSHLFTFDHPPLGEENVPVRPKASNGLDQPRVHFNAECQRHQSVPANLFSKKVTVDKRNPLHPSESQRHDVPLQEISNNILKKLDSVEKNLLERIPATPSTQAAAVQPAPAPARAPTVTAAAPDRNRVEQPPARTRKKKPSRAERQRKFPKLNRNVPAHLRLPDEGIIAIGRCINHYDRHSQAPYAFSWDGTLFAEYKRLLVKTVDGKPVWTADEINRLRR